jgi:diguanylate cyclase (GGDEF)-like protein
MAAAAAELEKDRLQSQIGHEMRTALNSVLSLTRFALRSSDWDEVRGYLKGIDRAGHGMVDSLARLLGATEAEPVKERVSSKPCDLGAVFERVMGSTIPLIAERSIDLSCSRDPSSPERLACDAGKLERVLEHLVSNAIARVQVGQVELHVREVKRMGERHLLFCVHRTVGNPAEGLETHPTDRRGEGVVAERGDVEEADASQAVLTRLIEAMGGNLRPERRSATAAEVCFTLPLTTAEGLTEPAANGQPAERPAQSAPQRGKTSKPVLVAEDNPVNQHIAEELLERMGLESRFTANGREALEMLQSDPTLFGLVLMDMRMPVMDGYDCTRTIRQDPRLAHLPVVAMTAHALNGDRERCLAAGANDYVSKPIDQTQFVRTVRRWLRMEPESSTQNLVEREALGDGVERREAAASPVLDIEAGLAWTDGDQQLYAQLAVDFIRSYNDKLKLLEPETLDLHVNEIQTLAHTLKSSAAILGAAGLREQATLLDAEFKETRRQSPATVAELSRQLKAVIEALRTYLEHASEEREEPAVVERADSALVQQARDQITAKGRVLVVDDERINQKLLAEVLSEENELLLADDGEQAIQLAHKTPQPDLILLDIVMPGIDGYEVCRRLKQDPETETIPIVFISGNISNEDERRGLQLGAIDYIRKPFNSLVVKARVRNHVAFKRQADMLEQLSLVDGLTGIANRRRLDEYVTQAWHNAMRNGSLVALMMMDIDYFKRYNDHYGHGAGDECLRQVAQALDKLCWRKTELVARYGGEEFAWVLLDTGLEEAMALAEKVLGTIRSLAIPHEKGTAEGVITMSIGVAATAPTPERRLEDFINTADQHLYEAKERGRARVVG